MMMWSLATILNEVLWLVTLLGIRPFFSIGFNSLSNILKASRSQERNYDVPYNLAIRLPSPRRLPNTVLHRTHIGACRSTPRAVRVQKNFVSGPTNQRLSFGPRDYLQ
ncbi:hypothetical protein Pst134EA_015413 [Puccinia striiformis f. sp. tritici]|uniref:hypothetical protein n=1 Tax=Puccinia striiformis f. sp. tritici TaxID=168172 RepID=UPI0020072FC9|nr:hypothetical protein Pst134EA_015413 [Puccinia striiformis f. sp. tritici]KAH9463329.1 hypothetical protein Pst134EA_015413 [Puccinia striiformis f. sp. tritici]